MKKRGSLFTAMVMILFAIAMVSCAGDTGGGRVPAVNHPPKFTLVSQPIFIAKNANFNQVVQHATDDDPFLLGSLTCYVQNNTCSFAVTVTGTGQGAVDCTASFTAPGSAEACSFTIAVKDWHGLSATDMINVEVARVWYVDDSATGAGTGLDWTNAFTTVQAGIAAASEGDFVFVADGTYTPTNPGDGHLLLMKAGVKIFGGFAGTESSTVERQAPIGLHTVLDGDSACHVVNGASYSRLDGFFITNGYAGAGCPSQVGGGIYNHGVYYSEFNNLIIRYNYSGSEAGGMFNRYSNISLDNSEVQRNFAYERGGGILNLLSTASVDNSVIAYNYYPGNYPGIGGGIANDASDLQITNSLVINNLAYAGGGIGNFYGANLGINNSSIRSNKAYYGGGIINAYYSYLVVEDSTIERNQSLLSGGILTASYSNNYINNSVFTDNLAYEGGGAIFNGFYAYSDVLNSTFENNFGFGYIGGGILNYSMVSSYVDSSIFKANNAEFAGGAIANYDYVQAEITNSVFVGNTAYNYGGAVTTWYNSDTYILNDTFTGNAAYAAGGAVANGPGGRTTISNSILWDDMAAYTPTPEIFDYDVGASYVVYSDIMDGWEGYGHDNINADPLFMNAPAQWDACIDTGTKTTLEVLNGSIYQVGDVIEIELDGVARTVTAVAGNIVTFTPAFPVNTEGGMVVAIWGAGATNLVLDLSLQPTSPAIDAGWGNAGTAPVVDILGNPRPSGATWDLGAYEYQQ